MIMILIISRAFNLIIFHTNNTTWGILQVRNSHASNRSTELKRKMDKSDLIRVFNFHSFGTAPYPCDRIKVVGLNPSWRRFIYSFYSYPCLINPQPLIMFRKRPQTGFGSLFPIIIDHRHTVDRDREIYNPSNWLTFFTLRYGGSYAINNNASQGIFCNLSYLFPHPLSLIPFPSRSPLPDTVFIKRSTVCYQAPERTEQRPMSMIIALQFGHSSSSRINAACHSENWRTTTLTLRFIWAAFNSISWVI